MNNSNFARLHIIAKKGEDSKWEALVYKLAGALGPVLLQFIAKFCCEQIVNMVTAQRSSFLAKCAYFGRVYCVMCNVVHSIE